MKKIFNRVLAAAVAVPMALTQGVMMNISAEDTGAKVITVDSFFAIPKDQVESTWNTTVLTAITNMNGKQVDVLKDELLSLLPDTNYYATILWEVLSDADVTACNVMNGVITFSGEVDLSNYAEQKIYSKVRAALGADAELTAFSKTLTFTATVDAKSLLNGKTVDVDYEMTCDGTSLTPDNVADYFNGLQADLIAEIESQFGAIADMENAAEVQKAADVELIDKVEKAQYWASKDDTLVRNGSYNTADELLAAVSKFVADRTAAYTCPTTVDEAVERHGKGFTRVVGLVNRMADGCGYTFDVTAEDVAEVAKSGSEFEVAVADGTYEVSFKIPDAEAAEVEAYVNANAEEGKAYDSSYKLVEASVTTEGVAYFNVTRIITMKDVEVTTTTATETSDVTTTTATTDDSTVTTTETTTGSGTGTGTDDSSTTTTETTTGSGTGTDDSSTTTTETTTGSGTGTGTDDSSTTTTETTTGSTTGTDDSSTTTTETTTGSGTGTETSTTTTLPANFVLAKVEAEAGEGYYFSHDEEAFDLNALFTSLTLVGTLDGEEKTIAIAPEDFAQYLTLPYETPAAYYEAVSYPYIAEKMNVKFTAPEDVLLANDYDATPNNLPMIYIAVKGDSDLNGKVEINDASLVLTYYAKAAAGLDATMNANADLETLAYFVADINTEAKTGANTDSNKLEINDATWILNYYASSAAGLGKTWAEIVG